VTLGKAMADLGHGDGRERWRRRSMQLPAHENLGIEAAIARLRAAAPHAKTERMVAPRKRMSARQRRELEHKAAIHTDTRWYNVHKKVAPVFFDEKAQTVAKRLFNMLDADGGGEIDSGEFSDALHFCGATPIEQDVKELVRLGDQDDNGTIDLDEFISMMCNPNTLASMESGALSKSIPPLSLWMLTYNRRKDMEGTTVPMLRKWMREEAAELLAKRRSDSKQGQRAKRSVAIAADSAGGGADRAPRAARDFSEELDRLIDGTSLDTLQLLGHRDSRAEAPLGTSAEHAGLLARIQRGASSTPSAPRASSAAPRSRNAMEGRTVLHDRRARVQRKVVRLRAKQQTALTQSPVKPSSVAAQSQFLEEYCGTYGAASRRTLYDARAETAKQLSTLGMRNQNAWCASPFVGKKGKDEVLWGGSPTKSKRL